MADKWRIYGILYMSNEWKSLEQLDREIARLEGILVRGPVKGKLWTPNMTRSRIGYLTRTRRQFTWPQVYRLRVALSALFQTLSDWTYP